ncbi:NosD domain-containing protein [Halorientalis salina]|uniref:NosD domain-containing protein n=1 Tax=Halorientalis salina TaxID=2932266 RepID=UPI0010AC0CB0|nr:NosD domain-containing protein [Halorientalis salina]
MDVKYALVALLAVLAVMATGFTVSPDVDRSVQPVPFDETLRLGLSGVDVLQAEDAGYSIPQAQVFYTQYQYVVGYYGVDAAADHLAARGTARQFGRPIEVLVTDYTGAKPTLAAGDYLVANSSINISWVPARQAHFVVESRARTPGGPAVVPFSSPDAARSFADEYDGRVVEWNELLARTDTQRTDPGEQRDTIVNNRSAWADESVRRTATLADRPVSVVVGEDAPNLSTAIERAEPNTTVRLPPGTYDVNLTVDKPVTITGAGNETHLRGPGTGTVLEMRASGSAVTDLRVSGVGPNGTRSLAEVGDDWDERIRVAYGRGDSAIRFENASGSLVSGVHVDTPATGLIVHNSSGTVVRDSTVRGSEEWVEGFMGVVAMYDPIVVQNISVQGGRDGVYTHRTPGIVVRDNRMVDMRYGVHEMYTSGSVVANNTMRGTNAGVIVMTRPRGNVLLGNDVRRNDIGLSMSGSASYIADNVVVDNGIGITFGADRSVITGNVVAGNDLGLRASTLLPSNEVARNDIVDNEVQVQPLRGPIRLWTEDRGNYWGPLPGRDADGDGTLDAAYYPTDDIEGALLNASGTVTLRESPAVGMIRNVQSAVPGLRESGIVDTATLAQPVNPEQLSKLNATHP